MALATLFDRLPGLALAVPRRSRLHPSFLSYGCRTLPVVTGWPGRTYAGPGPVRGPGPARGQRRQASSFCSSARLGAAPTHDPLVSPPE